MKVRNRKSSVKKVGVAKTEVENQCEVFKLSDFVGSRTQDCSLYREAGYPYPTSMASTDAKLLTRPSGSSRKI